MTRQDVEEKFYKLDVDTMKRIVGSEPQHLFDKWIQEKKLQYYRRYKKKQIINAILLVCKHTDVPIDNIWRQCPKCLNIFKEKYDWRTEAIFAPCTIKIPWVPEMLCNNCHEEDNR